METKTLVSALIALIIGIALGFIAAPRFGGMMRDHDGMMQNIGGMDHSQMGHDMSAMGTPKGDQGESSKAYAKANAAMHEAMDIQFSGNSDVDFAKGMIAHHEGAIEMSKVQLQFGKDADMRKLAEAIIAAQGPEIAQMKEWLAKNGG